MKLYTSLGPNPHVVRMFLAEKGITLPTQTVDVRGGETRRAPYLTQVNPRGQSPALELDDGRIVSEITAICEYLEERHPAPALIGSNAEERAETRMWTRRIDLSICEPLANGYRYGEAVERFRERFRVIPQAADELKALAQDNLAWLDKTMADRTWLCDDRFTLADILLFGFLHFGAAVGQPIDPAKRHIVAWYERVGNRPSAKA